MDKDKPPEDWSGNEHPPAGRGEAHHRQVQGGFQRRQAASVTMLRKMPLRYQTGSQAMRDKQKRDLASRKTYHFFLLIENNKLTNIVSLTGNDLETSGLLYSAMFCTNQKNASLICKSSIFIHNCQNYSSEKWRKFHEKISR